MGFFNKLLGRKKKKGEDDEPGAEGAPEPRAETRPTPPPQKKAKAEPKPPPEAERQPETVDAPGDEPEAAPTEAMAEGSTSSSGSTVSGTIGSGGSSLRAMSSGSLRAAANMIQCNSCERDLPVPLATGVTVTCPFCLGRTAYRP